MNSRRDRASGQQAPPSSSLSSPSSSPPSPPITEYLDRARDGDRDALDELMPLIYRELRALARSHRAGQRAGVGEGLGTESLVHEAYLRMAKVELSSRDRSEFFALASAAMRSLLVDNARHRQRQKRGGRRQRVELQDGMLMTSQRAEEVLALDDALKRLEADDSELASVVECRFFAGLSVEETAETLSLSTATVKRRWASARLRLYVEIFDGPDAG